MGLLSNRGKLSDITNHIKNSNSDHYKCHPFSKRYILGSAIGPKGSSFHAATFGEGRSLSPRNTKRTQSIAFRYPMLSLVITTSCLRLSSLYLKYHFHSIYLFCNLHLIFGTSRRTSNNPFYSFH